MRFFIALEIPEENKAQFQAIQIKVQRLIPQAELTDVDKIHLTLAFLGEQDEKLTDRLIEVIKKSTQGLAPFEVTPAYIDGFPNIHNPQVLWVGIKDDIDKVLLIRERIKDSIADLQLPVDERRFVPHITIAKLNNSLKVTREMEMQLQEIMIGEFKPINITSIKLFESAPDGGFHKHNTLAEVKLS